MKKLLWVLAIVFFLAAPALLFSWRYHLREQAPVWSAGPERVYLNHLENELLSGQLSRSKFIDRLREKTLLTGEAPLPLEAFVSLYSLASSDERHLLNPILPFYEKGAGAAEKIQLENLKKGNL